MTAAKKYDYWGIVWMKYSSYLKRYEKSGQLYSTQKELLEAAKKNRWAIVRTGRSNEYVRVNPATGKIAHIKDGKMIVPDHHNLPKNMAVLVGDDPQLAKPKKSKGTVTAKVKSPTISQRSPRYTVKVRDYYRRPPR